MLRRNLRSPIQIVGHDVDLLLGMDANPVIRHNKRATRLVRHVTSDAAFDAIYRAQSRVIRNCGAMASQTCLFGFGGQHERWRVAMRIMTVCARDRTRALTPTFAIL